MTTVQNLIAVARAEVGYHEGKSGGHWNNHQKYSETLPGAAWSDNQPWCDTFVHWVAWTAGVLNLWPDVTTSAPGGSASCDISAAAWKKAGRWSEYPAIGAQVFYGSPSDLNHTGLVTAYDDTYIWTVEGNTNDTGSPEGDGVYVKQRLRASANVVGYGYPAYPEGIQSADPAWATQTPPEVPVATSYVIDVSHYQAGLKIAALKAQGYAAVILKCTEGSTYADPSYADFLAQAEACGMPVAAYHFLHTGSGDRQAAWLAKNIRDKSVPVMIDAEAGGKPRWADVLAFIAGCTKRGLEVTLLYLPRSYWAAIGSPSLKGAPGIVNAAYPAGYTRGYGSALYPGNSDSHWDAYGGVVATLWQYTSAAKIDGYSGNVDVSAFRGGPDQLAAYFHTWGAVPAPTPTPAPAPTPKDWFDMATQADLTAAIAAALRVHVPANEDSWPGKKDVSFPAYSQRVLGQLANVRAENAALSAKVDALEATLAQAIAEKSSGAAE